MLAQMATRTILLCLAAAPLLAFLPSLYVRIAAERLRGGASAQTRGLFVLAGLAVGTACGAALLPLLAAPALGLPLLAACLVIRRFATPHRRADSRDERVLFDRALPPELALKFANLRRELLETPVDTGEKA